MGGLGNPLETMYMPFQNRVHRLQRLNICIFIVFNIFHKLCQHICMQMTGILCQNKYIIEIENVVKEAFVNVCHWFYNNKVLIHFGEGKTK